MIQILARAALVFAMIIMVEGVLRGEANEFATEVGTYRVWKLDAVPGPFEATDACDFVVARDGQRGLPEFVVFSLNDPIQVVARKSGIHASSWKVVGDELFVGIDGGWDVYSIPSLTKSREIRPDESKTPVALAQGWLYGSAVYDDSASKVIASFRGYNAEGKADLASKISSHDLAALYDLPYRNQTPGNPYGPAYLPNFPFSIELSPHRILLTNFDSLPVGIEEHEQAYLRTDPQTISIWKNSHRKDGSEGILIQLRDLKYALRDVSSYTRFAWKQPSMLVDSQSLAEWKYEFLDGEMPVDCEISTYPAIDDSGLFLLNPKGRHPLDALSTSQDLKQCQSMLDSYAEQAAPEFERMVGRAPVGIPVSIEITATRGEASFTHFAWMEFPKEDLLLTCAAQAVERNLKDEQVKAAKERAEEMNAHSHLVQAARQRNQSLIKQTQEKLSAKNTRILRALLGGMFFLLAIPILAITYWLGGRKG